jgi:rod shape-determining protein MreC
VHDKQVRRRRAVLLALVVVSLILLTAYFGQPQSSPLHTLQRGIVQVLSPIQEGASKVLTPFRDVAGWFSDTLHAKSRADQLQKQNSSLRAQLAQAQSAELLNRQLAKQVGLDQSNSIAAYQKLSASVISHDATLWYETVEVNKGSSDGVRINDPVVWEGGLVGKVSAVGSTYSEVTLITDHTFAAAGVLVPRVGNPNQLVLQDLPTINPGQPAPQVGQQVVTLGFKNGPLQDLYPAGIPIGQVSDANQNNLYNNHQVVVSPTADLRHLSAVQILIKPNPGTARAQVPSG